MADTNEKNVDVAMVRHGQQKVARNNRTNGLQGAGKPEKCRVRRQVTLAMPRTMKLNKWNAQNANLTLAETPLSQWMKRTQRSNMNASSARG